MVFLTTPGQRLLTTIGIAIFSCSFYLSDAKAQSVKKYREFIDSSNFRRNRTRYHYWSEVPNPALTSATAVTGAVPDKANVEMQPDGSLVYELAGQNQQGFRFIVDVGPPKEK